MGSCLWGFTFFLSSRRPREPRSEAGRDMKRKRIRGGQGQGWILFQRLSRLLNRWPGLQQTKMWLSWIALCEAESSRIIRIVVLNVRILVCGRGQGGKLQLIRCSLDHSLTWNGNLTFVVYCPLELMPCMPDRCCAAYLCVFENYLPELLLDKGSIWHFACRLASLNWGPAFSIRISESEIFFIILYKDNMSLL